MLIIRISPELEEILNQVVKETGKTKTYHVEKALLNYLEDTEDYNLADAAYKKFLASNEKTIPLSEVMNEI